MASDIIVERILDYRDGATNRPVVVRIHRPEQRGSGWICTTELEGCTGPEIAATLGIPVDTAYTRLRRAGAKVHRYAACLLAEQERRHQIRQVFSAAHGEGFIALCRGWFALGAYQYVSNPVTR